MEHGAERLYVLLWLLSLLLPGVLPVQRPALQRHCFQVSPLDGVRDEDGTVTTILLDFDGRNSSLLPWLTSAQQCMQEGLYLKAASCYQRALEISPGLPLATSNLAFIQAVHCKNLQEAERLMRSMAGWNVSMVPLLNFASILWHREKPDYAEAERIFNMTIQRFENHSQPLVSYAEYLINRPPMDRNVSSFKLHTGSNSSKLSEKSRIARAVYPSNGTRRRIHANLPAMEAEYVKNKSRDFFKAEQILKKALLFNPEHTEARAVFASLKVAIGKKKEAEALLRDALRIDPHDCDCLNLYASLLSRTEREDEAIQMYRKALALNPQDVATILVLAKLMEKRHEYWERVLSLYRQAAAIEPMNADLYFNLGRVLATGGNDRKTAGYFYNIAKNLDPYHASAWNSLALTQMHFEQADLALKTFREAISLHPKVLEIRSNFATLLQLTGQIDEAKHHYEELLKLDPQHVQTLCSYSSMLSERYQDHERAYKMLHLALKLQPAISEIRKQLVRSERQVKTGSILRFV